MNAPHAKKRTTLRTLNNISDKTPLLTSDSTSTTCFPGSRNLPIVRIVALRLEGTNLSELPGIKNQKPEVHARAGTGSFGIDRDLPRWGLEPAEWRRNGKKRTIVAAPTKLVVLLLICLGYQNRLAQPRAATTNLTPGEINRTIACNIARFGNTRLWLISQGRNYLTMPVHKQKARTLRLAVILILLTKGLMVIGQD